METTHSDPRQVESNAGQWNVQVVRGKVTTRCLWNACKALSIGLFLMSIGATMAIVGYHADQLSIRNEIRGNSTVRVKNESRGFHLNNLSYAGPIIMGVGGFIVVAACVMTFEARDSAAKVVPARFKPNMNSSVQASSTKSTPHNLRSLQRLESKINNSCQTPVSKGSYRIGNLGSGDRSPINDPMGRKLLTSAFVQFSRALMEDSPLDRPRNSWRRASEANLNKSPSAPNLVGVAEPVSTLYTQRQNYEESRKIQKRGSPKTGLRLYKEQIRTPDRCTLLSPQLLQRQALSVDNPFYESYGCCSPPPSDLCRQCSGRSEGSHDSLHMELGASAGVSGSQASMALDLHDCQVTLKVKDEAQNRRSEMSRRHQLLRQRPVEEERDPPLRCSCISPIIYANVSDDSVTKTNKGRELLGNLSLKLMKRGELSPKARNFYRSRSCTDDRTHERKIYCIEDHKKRKYPSAEKLKWDLRSPNRTRGSSHIHRRVNSTKCAIHDNSLQSQVFIRKNVKRRKSFHRLEGSVSTEESRSNLSRSPTAASPFRNGSLSLSRTNLHEDCFNTIVSPKDPS